MLIGNLFIIPSLLLYYRAETRKLIFPVVMALFLFYIRDIFLLWGFSKNPYIIFWAFLMGILILLLLAITELKRKRLHPIELVSFFIMYGFLIFLFLSLSEIVPNVIPSYSLGTYFYLFLLMLFLAISFTGYLMKSHYASLCLMLVASSLIFSELSLFFKLYIIEDLSVNIFFPIFHLLTYFFLVQYGINRRQTGKLPYF